MMEFPALDTERLHLVRIGHEHAADLFEIHSDPTIAFFYGIERHDDVSKTIAVIDALEQKFRNGVSIEWGLVLKDGGKLIGTVGFNTYQAGVKGAIGFGLNSAFRRRHFASEAVRAVMRYGFETLRLHRIDAETDPRNEAAQHLLRSCGFVQEGILRENELLLNEFCSTVVFGRLVSDP